LIQISPKTESHQNKYSLNYPNELHCRPVLILTITFRATCVLQLSIGNERYICSCVRNETSEGEGPDSGSKHLPLVIGLSVGLGVLLIVVFVLTVLIVWIVLRRRRNKTPSGSNDSIELDQDDQQHYAIGGAAAPPEDEKPPNYEPLK